LPFDGLLLTNQGVYTGLSVATVSIPLVYRYFWIEALEQLAVLALAEPAAAGLLELVLPQAARLAPMTVTAAASMMRRMYDHSPTRCGTPEAPGTREASLIVGRSLPFPLGFTQVRYGPGQGVLPVCYGPAGFSWPRAKRR
jgi:hypothetical protein